MKQDEFNSKVIELLRMMWDEIQTKKCTYVEGAIEDRIDALESAKVEPS
jgi:hypothetical protein